MSNSYPHPEEATLVRLVDGELPPAESREVEQHLESCPACLAQVEELRATVAECLSYREQAGAVLPPPPRPWAELSAGFARIDRSPGQSREPWWRIRPALRWAFAAAAILVLAIVYEFRETPSVQAASLLHKAEIAAARRPATALRRVLIRTKSVRITRVIAANHVAPLPKEPAVPALETLFQAAHWDWNDPLSAQAFDDWRRPLKNNATDSVTATADAYQIRTTAPEGELAAASLTLRAADLEPIEARLEFRNQDWVELSESAQETAGSGAVATAPAAAAPAPSAAPAAAGGAPVPSVKAVPAAALLGVLAKLHEIGADLGEQVEVREVEGRLVVNGVGIPAERQRQIQAALEKFPDVTVEFSQPVAPPAGNPAAAEPVAPPAQNPAADIAARVERQLGGHPQFQRFSTQMLDENDAAMAQAYALRRLAQRFPASTEASFRTADRQALRAIARQNAAALAAVASKMDAALEPVLLALGGQVSSAPTASANAWQPEAEDLLLTAQRVERRLSVMLGAAPSDGTAFSPSDFLADLRHLQDDIAYCQRLLAQE